MHNQRLEPGRSQTWPQTSQASTSGHKATDDINLHLSTQSLPNNMLAIPRHRQLAINTKYKPDPFEDDLNKHPEDHFLSPVAMYEYEDWADSSDNGDDEEVEWDAGITDFALFDSDRRAAEAHQEDVPNRWNSLLKSQELALQRAVQRNRSNSDPKLRTWTPLLSDMPQLTPDNSPDPRDDRFGMSTVFGSKPPQMAGRPSYLSSNPVRSTRSFSIDAADSDLDDDYDATDEDDFYDSEDEDEADLPVSVLIERARERRRQARCSERPGLKFNRTLSGKLHVWRRPSWNMYTVGEDVEAERRAEEQLAHEEMQVDDDDEGRGRRR
ncbi:hypothetical protein TI39_contig429g00027 [Zymoseptoria brevis]|uniref:Uncharacterized protein n=1 Tax=Zymoseptoria brevis TaxID=1047168 RepID=A0A0F4GPN5_9PEZI|nr:hypothetical protein TI39_contig429g00027 [Zymoseptoria brevis]